MLMAMPRKSTKGMLPMPWGAKRMRRECASRAPIAKGSRMLIPLAMTRGGALASEMLVIEFHSDQKEEEHQADGGKGFEGP